MRLQGKIDGWNDDKRYGFVIQNGTGNKAFVHIKAFTDKRRRPINGDLITYELAKDSRGRDSAVNIRFTGDVQTNSRSMKDNNLGNIFLVSLFLFLTITIIMQRLPYHVAMLYVLASIVTYVAYALDKSAAKRNQWRTQESTLHVFSLIGGWPGALLAQRTLRHKSSKESFQTVFRATVVLNCAALVWLITPDGKSFLAMVIG